MKQVVDEKVQALRDELARRQRLWLHPDPHHEDVDFQSVGKGKIEDERRPGVDPPSGGYIDKDTLGSLYVMRPEAAGVALEYIKVGFTRNLERRRMQLQRGPFYTMRLHMSAPGTLRHEAELRRLLKPWRVNGKADWHHATAECLSTVESVVGQFSKSM